MEEYGYITAGLEVDDFGKLKPHHLQPGPWNNLGGTVISDLTALLPGLSTNVTCPCEYVNVFHQPHVGPVGSLVQHLNDSRGWSRERIADWLETLDVDLTFPTERPTPPAVKYYDVLSVPVSIDDQVFQQAKTKAVAAINESAHNFSVYMMEIIGSFEMLGSAVTKHFSVGLCASPLTPKTGKSYYFSVFAGSEPKHVVVDEAAEYALPGWLHNVTPETTTPALHTWDELRGKAELPPAHGLAPESFVYAPNGKLDFTKLVTPTYRHQPKEKKDARKSHHH